MKNLFSLIVIFFATGSLLSQDYQKVEINTDATLISPEVDSTDVHILFEESDTFEVRNLTTSEIMRIGKSEISEIIWDYPFTDKEVDTEGEKHSFIGSLVLLNYDNINAAAADMKTAIKDLCYGKIAFVEGHFGLFFSFWLYDKSWSISLHASKDEKYLVKVIDSIGDSRSMEIHSMDNKMRNFQSEDKLRNATYAEITTVTLLNEADLEWMSKRNLAEVVIVNKYKESEYDWKNFRTSQYKKNVLHTQLSAIQEALQEIR